MRKLATMNIIVLSIVLFFCTVCFMYSDVPRSSPRWHFVWIRKAQESVSLPSCVLRLLALPYSKSDGNTEARACTYTIVVHRNYSSRIKHGNDYATYLRASIVAHSLTLDMKFCENFKTPRISADKRFYIMFVVTPHLNGRDFGVNQRRKFRPLFLFGQ